jgi:hypothetical protein
MTIPEALDKIEIALKAGRARSIKAQAPIYAEAIAALAALREEKRIGARRLIRSLREQARHPREIRDRLIPTFALFALATLSGCILSPESKVVVRDHEASAACLQMEDSVTFSGSGEGWHYSCTIGDTARGSK